MSRVGKEFTPKGSAEAIDKGVRFTIVGRWWGARKDGVVGGRAENKRFGKVSLRDVGGKILDLPAPYLEAVALGVRAGCVYDETPGWEGEAKQGVARGKRGDTSGPEDGLVSAGAEIQVALPHTGKAVRGCSGEAEVFHGFLDGACA